MSNLSRIVLLLAGIGFAACGGSSSGGSVTGTIGGTSFAIQDVISAPVSIVDSQTGTTSHAAVIFMSTDTNLCTRIGTNTVHPSEKVVLIEAFNVDSSGTVTTPTGSGGYAVFGSGAPGPMAAAVDAVTEDATCMPVTASSSSATGGTVTLTSISGNVFDGTFDVSMATGDHLTGSFNPESCPGIQNAIGGSGSSVCM